MGRPSSFSQEIADEICERLINGESLRSICKSDNIPNQHTIINWLIKGEDEPDNYPEYKEFLANYTRARELQADSFVDEIVQIADDTIATTEDVAKSRLRIDTRKWAAGKMKPKKYGDKSTVELSGVDGKAIEVKSKADDELDARILELATKAGTGGVTKSSRGEETPRDEE